MVVDAQQDLLEQLEGLESIFPLSRSSYLSLLGSWSNFPQKEFGSSLL